MSEPTYPSAEIAINVAKLEYEYELNRSIKLDNKINITITFCGVIFLFIIKYLDLTAIINASSSWIDCCLFCLIKIFCCIGYILAVFYFLHAVIKLINLLKTSTYLHFNCDEIFNLKLIEEKEDVTNYYISTQYLAATSKNNETNEIRSNEYNKVIHSLIMLLLISIIVEAIKYNFLGLGV